MIQVYCKKRNFQFYKWKFYSNNMFSLIKLVVKNMNNQIFMQILKKLKNINNFYFDIYIILQTNLPNFPHKIQLSDLFY